MALLETDRITPVARARVLAVAALGPLLTGYAAVAAVMALVTAIASRSHFSTVGVLIAALPGWLAAHQVPLIVQGHELGVLPLLPTLLLMLLVARTAAGAAERVDAVGLRETGHVVFAVVAAHAALGLTIALVLDGGPVVVDPLAGFYYPALLAGVAACVGLLRRSGALDWCAERVDDFAWAGLRAGTLAVVALLTAGSLVVTFGLVTSYGAANTMFAADGPGSALGMLLLSAGYLPNAVIAGTAFIAGPGFSMGSVSIAPLDFDGGPVPALPLLSALPEQAAAWWLALFLLPAAVGALVGWVLRSVAESPKDRLRSVAVASVVVALSFAVLAGSAGGALAGGPFHPLDLRAALVSFALACWVAVPGGFVAWFAGERPVVEGPVGLIDPEDPDDDEDPEDSEDADDSEDSADEAMDEALEEPVEDSVDDETDDEEIVDDSPDEPPTQPSRPTPNRTRAAEQDRLRTAYAGPIPFQRRRRPR
ncbi:cell division protein PerM [Actinokineospora sp.]|uniref:cell division protein PerM n=1 Tax=Actinokineospora sp. TaxID=1872133 RepID=UPI003D6C6859